MTFTYFPYKPIEIDDGLSIEILNTDLFQSFIREMLSGFETGCEQAVIYEEDKQVAFNSGLVITDLFRFDVNDKKLLTRLTQDIVKRMNIDADFMNRFDNISSQFIQLIKEFTLDEPMEIDYNDVKVEDYVKLFSPRISTVFDGISASLTAFLQFSARFKLYKFIAVVGLNDLLGEDETQEIKRQARACSIPLLLIDHFRHAHKRGEKVLTISEGFDEDIL